MSLCPPRWYRQPYWLMDYIATLRARKVAHPDQFFLEAYFASYTVCEFASSFNKDLLH
jgi:hypothetical protein